MKRKPTLGRAAATLGVVQNSNVLDGLASKISLAEKNPLAVRFNPANDLNQPQLLFVRVDHARQELLFSKLPEQPRPQCKRVISLKLCKELKCKSKCVFSIILQGASPVDLEAHDAFACKQWLQLLGPLIVASPLMQVDVHAFPSRALSTSSGGALVPPPSPGPAPHGTLAPGSPFANASAATLPTSPRRATPAASALQAAMPGSPRE